LRVDPLEASVRLVLGHSCQRSSVSEH
jgi:hypothetical protein